MIRKNGSVTRYNQLLRDGVAQVLKECFPHIRDVDRLQLVALGHVRELAVGETICEPGTPPEGLAIIMSGELQVEQDGRRLRGFGPGSFLGEGRLVRETSPLVTIRATEQSLIFSVPHQECRALLRTNPTLGYDLTSGILLENINRLETMNALFVENHRLSDELTVNNAKLRGMNDRLSLAMAQKLKAEEQMRHLASHDPVTGLPNRSMFMEFLEVALSQAERHGARCAVHYIDLQDFKEINQIHGHAVGDGVLRAFAAKLKECIRTHDTAARVGDDEFVIAQTNVFSAGDITSLSERLVERMQQAEKIGDVELLILAHSGISVCPDDAKEAASLIRNAQMALHQAKAGGEAQFHFFESGMEDEARRATDVKHKLHGAITAGRLTVYYQPKVSLTDRRIVGMEALVRWKEVEAEGITTSEFITVAERTGQIGRLGEIVLREACRQTQAWRKSGLGALKVAVNVSPMQFVRQDMQDVIDTVLDDTGLQAAALEIEVTEGVLLNDDARVLATLSGLSKRGITIAVDDFGTGYSSLSYLKRLSAHTVKIDRTFVKDSTVDPDDASICEAIVGLAKSLNLKVVAEGVEREDHVVFLRDLGCDEGQGYLFTKPLPAPDFERFVDAWGPGSASPPGGDIPYPGHGKARCI